MLNNFFLLLGSIGAEDEMSESSEVANFWVRIVNNLTEFSYLNKDNKIQLFIQLSNAFSFLPAFMASIRHLTQIFQIFSSKRPTLFRTDGWLSRRIRLKSFFSTEPL